MVRSEELVIVYLGTTGTEETKETKETTAKLRYRLFSAVSVISLLLITHYSLSNAPVTSNSAKALWVTLRLMGLMGNAALDGY